MRLAVFFMSLCFLLWRGNSHIFMAMENESPAHHSSKPLKVRFTNTDYSFLADTDVDTEEEHVISDDDMDDCSGDFLAQQFKLLAMCYACVPYQSILTYHHKCYKDPPSFLGKESHKYILQGVLRI